MNLRLIETALNAYSDVSQDDTNRLTFFKSIWDVQARSIQGHPCDYEVPSTHDLELLHSKLTPVFSYAPVTVDVERLVEDAVEICECIVCKDMLAPDVQRYVKNLNWAATVTLVDVAQAGKDPQAYLSELAEKMVAAGTPAEAVRTVATILRLALRCQLEKPAEAVMKALRKAELAHVWHSTTCPCCASEPTLAHVGGETSSQGRGRLLVCPQCATAWEFDRIRCTRCGQTNPNHLHYYNIEGDDAHRIQTCDDCGGYMRTVFSEEGALRPVSYEVEDVVMARLDALAQDPRFNK